MFFGLFVEKKCYFCSFFVFDSNSGKKRQFFLIFCDLLRKCLRKTTRGEITRKSMKFEKIDKFSIKIKKKNREKWWKSVKFWKFLSQKQSFFSISLVDIINWFVCLLHICNCCCTFNGVCEFSAFAINESSFSFSISFVCAFNAT